MKSPDFELQHADVPQSKELDGEIATRDWPMPNMAPWAPNPQPDPRPTLLERIAEVFR